MKFQTALKVGVSILPLVSAPAGWAQTQNAALEVIVVTAQKREQNLNDVGLAVSAFSSADLRSRNIVSVGDLAKAVPGFVYTLTNSSVPVYTIRGVGFYETSLASSPAVTVYTDEVPLPFPAMTLHAGLDIERVEVLKGPQGTVFGQNSTGGAVNYISAKPTETFEAGIDLSYQRFNLMKLDGYVSGPLSDTVGVRVAARVFEGGDWQKSQTRADDSLGDQSVLQGRVLVDYNPTERLSFLLNINGWTDQSDPQAPQITEILPANPDVVPPAIANAPLAPPKARLADWTPGYPDRDNEFYQIALRGSYDISDDIQLTSISSFQQLDIAENYDYDGLPGHHSDVVYGGDIKSFSQELRLNGQSGRLNWLIGGNYGHDKTKDNWTILIFDRTSSSQGIPGVTPEFFTANNFANQNIRTIAGFGNLEYEIVDNVTLQGGIRYTESRRRFEGCARGDQFVEETFEIFQNIFKGSFIPIPRGGCVTLDTVNQDNLFNPGLTRDTLKENNVSWRGGINWKVAEESLLYANISRGYKAGSFPTLAGAFSIQYSPIKQESVTAYELGFKASVLDRRLQVNGAGFYYDYENKQLRSKVLDPIFGGIDALVNIPKSRLWGAEMEINALPVEGLNLHIGATYLNSKMKDFMTFPLEGGLTNIGGNPYPYTPDLTIVSDAQYEWPVSEGMNAFVGGGLTYNSRSTSDIGDHPRFRIRPYTVVDARVGLNGDDDRWRVVLFAENLFDKYYWTNMVRSNDQVHRLTAPPRTFGISLNYRWGQ